LDVFSEPAYKLLACGEQVFSNDRDTMSRSFNLEDACKEARDGGE